MNWVESFKVHWVEHITSSTQIGYMSRIKTFIKFEGNLFEKGL